MFSPAVVGLQCTATEGTSDTVDETRTVVVVARPDTGVLKARGPPPVGKYAHPAENARETVRDASTALAGVMRPCVCVCRVFAHSYPQHRCRTRTRTTTTVRPYNIIVIRAVCLVRLHNKCVIVELFVRIFTTLSSGTTTTNRTRNNKWLYDARLPARRHDLGATSVKVSGRHDRATTTGRNMITRQSSHGPVWVPAAVRRPVQYHLAGRVLLRHRVRRGHGLCTLLTRPLRAVLPDNVVRRRLGHRRADHVAALVPGRTHRRRQVHTGRQAQTVGRAGVALRAAGRPVEVSGRNAR